MTKDLQKVLKIRKSKDGWTVGFRDGWSKIWYELVPYLEDYRNNRVDGGTTWFPSITRPTRKEAFETFYSKIKKSYVVKNFAKGRDIKKKIIFIK